MPAEGHNVAVLPEVLFVTGTDTGVGKTIVTAALAAALVVAGRSVAVYKPTQAGLDDGAGDIDHVRRLAGIDEIHEGIRLPYPMAPVAAAQRAAIALPTAAAHVHAIQRLASAHDHTLVEGAGGALVQLDHDGATLLDIASAVAAGAANRAAAIVVCRAALGTLNHTELTLEALTHRGVTIAGVVIGSWPERPTEIEQSNLEYLSRHTVPLIGKVPAHTGQMEPGKFRAAAPGWFRLTA